VVQGHDGNILDYRQTFPQVTRIQQDVFERLTRDVVFEDITAVPAVFGSHQQDTLVQAKEQGFEDVVAFAYVMNPSCGGLPFRNRAFG